MILITLFKKYKSSYYQAFTDLFTHICLLWLSFTILYYFRNSWLSLFTISFLGLLNVKTFIIFHDCGHHSYTPSLILNYIIGIFMGIIDTNPFSWNFNHNTHHLTNGNKENNYDHKYNETIFHTLEEYKKMSLTLKKFYKFIKHPLIFFTIIPFIKFVIIMRFNAFRLLRKKKLSVKNMSFFIIIDQLVNNIGFYYLLHIYYHYGIFYHYLSAVVIGTSIGVMLFHNQHGFNPSYVVTNETWNKIDNGLIGSSYIKIPWFLKYFIGGIEYHHIHHINSKIPGYNLQKFHEEVKKKCDLFDNVPTLSMKDCYNNLWLTLYDEESKRYITFEEAEIKINGK